MPDIPDGAGLQVLGSGLQRIGKTIGRLSEQQQIAANAESSYEFDMAKATALSIMAQFSASLTHDPDDTSYIERWDKQAQAILDRTTPNLKMPGARQKWDVWWQQAAGEQRGEVMTAARNKGADRIEGGYAQLLEKYEKEGDPLNLQETAQSAYNAGIYNWDQMAMDSRMDKARYNRVVNIMREIPVDKALRAIEKPGFGERFDLTTAQVEQLDHHWTLLLGNEQQRQGRLQAAAERENFTKFETYFKGLVDGSIQPDEYMILDFMEGVPADKREFVRRSFDLYRNERTNIGAQMQENTF